MKNNPDIRFRGFDEEWDQSTLREISDKVMEKNSDFSIREVFTNSAEHGIMSQKDFFNHAIANNKNINGYYVVQPNDFVYNPRMSVTAPVGPINRNALGRTGIMSPLYYVFRTHDIGVEYLEYFFKTRIWHQFMWNNGDNGARGDRFSIKNEVFQEMPIPYPSSPEEQHKIAQFFSRLDSLITAEDKKLERLKKIKSASLEKMFPKQGETVPEVRFKGFTGEWMESRIGDCFSERKERSGIGEMLSVTINSGVRKARELDRTVHIGDTSNYKVVRQGDIAYNSMRMWQGASGYSQYDGIVSPAYTVIIPKERIDSRFFACLFKTQHMIHVFELNSQGLTSDTWNLKYGQLRSIPVKYPVDLKEQIYIAEYFSRLDTLISAQEQKSAKLRSLKKSFLEKMFVSTPK